MTKMRLGWQKLENGCRVNRISLYWAVIHSSEVIVELSLGAVGFYPVAGFLHEFTIITFLNRNAKVSPMHHGKKLRVHNTNYTLLNVFS